METMAKRLREIKAAMRWKRDSEIAKAANVTPGVVSMWLNEKSKQHVKEMGLQPAFNLQQVTGYCARWIVYGEGPKKSDLTDEERQVLAAFRKACGAEFSEDARFVAAEIDKFADPKERDRARIRAVAAIGRRDDPVQQDKSAPQVHAANGPADRKPNTARRRTSGKARAAGHSKPHGRSSS